MMSPTVYVPELLSFSEVVWESGWSGSKPHNGKSGKFPNFLILEHLKSNFIKPQLTK